MCSYDSSEMKHHRGTNPVGVNAIFFLKTGGKTCDLTGKHWAPLLVISVPAVPCRLTPCFPDTPCVCLQLRSISRLSDPVLVFPD